MIDGEEKTQETESQTKEERRDSDQDVEGNSKKMPNISNVLSLFFSLCLVAAAFLTFLAICVQAFIYNAQLREMKKSSDASIQAANAARESVKQARETARLDQRAWVATTTFDGRPEVNQPLKISIGTKNSGRTFAQQLVVNWHVRALPKGVEPDFSVQAQEPTSIALLAPNGEFLVHAGIDKKLSQEDVNLISSGEVVVFVFGEITYNDIFKCSHWTNFCSVLKPIDWTYTVYKKHNDADDNRCP